MKTKSEFGTSTLESKGMIEGSPQSREPYKKVGVWVLCLLYVNFFYSVCLYN